MAQGLSQVPPDQVPVIPVTPAGGGSSTVTDLATDGPALATLTVQLMDLPAVTGSAGPVLVIDKSASVLTGCVLVGVVAGARIGLRRVGAGGRTVGMVAAE